MKGQVGLQTGEEETADRDLDEHILLILLQIAIKWIAGLG